MIRFVAGLVLGLALAGGALFIQRGRTAGCFDRCGDGTRCQAGQCVPVVATAAPAPAPVDKKKRRRGRGSAGSDGDPGAGSAAPELALRPGDDAPASAGDALGRPEKLDLTEAGPDARELSEADIERVFAPARDAISGCITRAVGDYPLESGRIEVGYRIERSGAVERIRVAAPALLVRQGLYKCVRPLVAALRFPASGAASVVTFPFTLQ